MGGGNKMGEGLVSRLRSAPRLWMKCPKCKEVIYLPEARKTNECGVCLFVFPVPLDKVEQVRDFIRQKNPTIKKISNFILDIRRTVNPDQEQAFLKAIYREVVIDHLEWLQTQNKKN